MPMMEFLDLDEQVIIATKGLPCTGKSEIARFIAEWSVCPLLDIDQFLDTLSLEKDYTFDSLPSLGEAERLHRLAFDVLCKAASDNLQWRFSSIVVKSRLCSTFEVDRLVQLGKERGCGMILIIEFRMNNEYRYWKRFEHKVDSGRQKEWYKPRSWKDDIEKAMDDYEADNWDLHLRNLLSNGDGLPSVTRLVLDPFDDLYLFPHVDVPNMTVRIINHLLGTAERVQHGELVVQYGEVGRSLREKDLSGPRSRSTCGHKYLCYACKNDIHICLLKYWKELEADVDDEGNPYYCEVCEERVILGQSGYACHFCTLTLHQSCAEITANNADFNIQQFEDNDLLRSYPDNLPWGGHSCKSCLEQGKGFTLGCRACAFQTHLKCRVLPTILNHDCHDHFLFMNFYNVYKCKACGTDRPGFGGSYGCYICDQNYDIECLSLAREPEHEHGGHQHTLKLMYSHDGMDKEEAYWCEMCYEDMDPQNWFYYCQDCPYFEAHPNCVRRSRSKDYGNPLERLRSLLAGLGMEPGIITRVC